MRNDVSLLAALSLAALTAASPALAETLTVTGIDHKGNVAHVVAPTVEVVDGNIDEATIQQMFSDGIVGDAASAMAGLEAASFSIPSMTLTKTTDDDGKGPSTVEITNLELTDVAAGVAAGLTIEKMVFKGGEENAEATIGPISFTDFSLATLLTLGGVLPDAPVADAPLPLFGSLDIDGASMTADNGTCSVDATTSGPLSIRPLKTMSWAEGMALMERVENEKTPTPADTAKLIAFNADIMTAYDAGSGEITGVECSGTDEQGKPFVLEVARLSNSDANTGVTPQMTIENVHVEGGDGGVMSLESLLIRPMGFAHVIEALQAAGEDVDSAWMEANYRKLIPWFGGFALSGLTMDVPAEQQGGRIKFTIGSVDLSLDAYENGIPTDIYSATGDFSITIPEGAEGADALKALGYDTLDLNYDLTAHWDSDAQTIVIERLSISEGQSGTLVLSATLGNATANLFADQPQLAMAAATVLTVKDIKIDVSDVGLLTKLMAIGAAEQKIDEPTFRAAMGSVVQGTVLMGMGASPSALQVAQAIQDFIGGMPHLTLTASAIDPAGITLMDFQLAQNDPGVLLRKLTITAESGDILAEDADAPAEGGAEAGKATKN